MSHTRRAVEDGWSLPTRRLDAVEAAVDADILVLLSWKMRKEERERIRMSKRWNQDEFVKEMESRRICL